MGELRRPLLVLAFVVLVLALLVELGAGLVLGGADASVGLAGGAQELGLEVGDAAGVVQPSGLGIRYLALLDGILVFAVGLIVLSLVVSKELVAKLQGVVTLIGSILLILGAVVLLVVAFALLTVMVSLLAAVPFGTLAYLALWGFFPVDDSAVLLGLLLLLKLAFGGLLIAAHPRFLQNKGLVLLTVTTLVFTVGLAFLHGFVPGFLVSIVDTLVAVVLAIVAIVWALVLLIGSIPAIVKAVRSTATT